MSLVKLPALFLPGCAKTGLIFFTNINVSGVLYTLETAHYRWIPINEVSIDTFKLCDGYRLCFIYMMNIN